MNLNKIKYICNGLFAILVLGCTEPIDFDQANDLLLEPVTEASLVFYNANAGDFIVGDMEEDIIQDFIDIDLFNSSFVQDHLVKVEFVFDVKNSINRSYVLQLDFLDENGQPLQTFQVDSPASPSNQVVTTEHIQVFEGAALESLKQSRLLVFTLVMRPGVPVDENTPGEIDLKSKAIVYLSIEG